MKPESIEELRERLLREEQVKEMISMRAYEIYQMRGAHPGREAEDWLRAENEILSFLIQEESRRSREQEESPQEPATVEASGTLETSALQAEAPPKKNRSRAASKTGTGAKKPAAKKARATTAKKTAAAEKPAAKKSASTKSAAKKSAAKKPSAKRATTKKSGTATQESEK